MFTDYNILVKKPGTGEDDPTRKALKTKFVKEFVRGAAAGAANTKEATKADYMSNLESLQALDHAMMLGTVGARLVDFVVQQEFRPRTLLLPHRYCTQANALPENMSVALGCTQRCCIRDATTGNLRCDWQFAL